MTPSLVLLLLMAYFGGLLWIAHRTAGDEAAFFTANRRSPWYVVAFGMIGASLSGVTFLSVPGWVGTTQFGYLQMVLGYQVGYALIAGVLLPLYYRLGLVSIYQYLEQRLGTYSYKTGAAFFLLSRTIGAAFRLYLVATVLQLFLFDAFGWPFAQTVILTIALIWLYTFRGGIGTIIWTDTLQTAFMLLSLVITVYLLAQKLGWHSWEQAQMALAQSPYTQIFFWDNPQEANYFWKNFWGGAAIALVMTGLDQDMMQKNLTCRSLSDAQKNMFWFSLSLIPVNALFLTLGAMLYLFAAQAGIPLPEKADTLFPLIVQEHLPVLAGVVFLLGIMAAAYSSADSALTSLTTSFCVDFLDFEKTKTKRAKKRNQRLRVHLTFSVLLILIILVFHRLSDQSVIQEIFRVAGYTYGPLLGLFAFGLLTRASVRDRYVPYVCLVSPVLTYLLQYYAATVHGYSFGFELVIINGMITFVGLSLLWQKK
ncbi:MAG: sodium:solute symporter [Bernardetiaceae bacterium]